MITFLKRLILIAFFENSPLLDKKFSLADLDLSSQLSMGMSNSSPEMLDRMESWSVSDAGFDFPEQDSLNEKAVRILFSSDNWI